MNMDATLNLYFARKIVMGFSGWCVRIFSMDLFMIADLQ